ncbi:MAG: type II toxin-antitoxin system PemK/MazF family toxin [Tunicatimonas sp.]
MTSQVKKIEFGDIVLLEFPFTDGQRSKKRPALMLLDTQDGDMIVCRITSKLHHTAFDFVIQEWQAAGLKLPSVVRVHKIATLERGMVLTKFGTINEQDKKSIQQIFRGLLS